MQSRDSYAYPFPATNRQSGDYYSSHISKLEKSPSEHGDGPPYQNNIHLLFKPRPTHDDHHVPITQFHVKFDDEEAQGRKDHLGKTTERFQVNEHDDVGRKIHVQDVNTAAGDFISRKHRTYEMQKLMSMRRSDQGSY